MSVYFVQTNDEEQIVRIPSNEADGYAEIISADEGPRDFNLTNTLKSSAMKEARAAAREAGLKLRKPNVMGFRSR